MTLGISFTRIRQMPQELTVSLPQKVACHEKPHSLYSYIVNVSYSMAVQIICDISGGGL